MVDQAMRYELIGDFSPALVLDLAPGQMVQAEPGAMMYMTEGITMETSMRGGFFAGLKRKFLAGESFFLSRFIAQDGGGRVVFAAPFPGQILPVFLSGGPALLCQRSSYLCSVGAIGFEPIRVA